MFISLEVFVILSSVPYSIYKVAVIIFNDNKVIIFNERGRRNEKRKTEINRKDYCYEYRKRIH